MSAHPRDLAGDVAGAIITALCVEHGIYLEAEQVQTATEAAHAILAREQDVRERPVPALVEETLRDRFAQAALGTGFLNHLTPEAAAERAYQTANAMLAARKVKP